MHRSLLTGTALAVLMMASPVVIAQEVSPAVLAAYQQYAAARVALSQAQSGGVGTEAETQAAIAAQQGLADACAGAGIGSVGECLNLLPPDQRVPGDLDPIPPAQPAPVAPAAEEPVAEPEMPTEPEAPEVPQVEPAEPEAPEPQPVEEPTPEPEAEPEPVEEPAPEPETVAEPEPQVEPEPAPEAEVQVEETPVEPEPAAQAPAEEPAAEETPVAEEAEPAPAETPAEQPAPAEQAEPVEPTEPVDPEANGEVNAEEVAPLLDSAKEETNAEAQAAQAASEDETTPESNDTEAQAAPVEPPAPPPANDAEAQADATPVEIAPLTEEVGEVITPEAAAATIVTAPEAARVVEQQGPDFRIVFEFNNQLIVRNQDQPRLGRDGSDRTIERLRNGRTRETIDRPNGTRIITIYNRNGDILRRSRFTPDGEEYILVYVDEDREADLLEWRDPGRDLPPLRLTIPAREYILDAEDVDEDELVLFLDQPPVERVRRLYSIDEVKRSARVRDSVRRLEVGNLSFDTGKATISPNQVGALTSVANAMLDLLEQNPAETFLIEGHTDAVGSDISNLSLSDRRAETIAIVLSDLFGVPPENLATQGYGERYLKVRTEAAEPLNRRVTIRRITPLVSPLAQR